MIDAVGIGAPSGQIETNPGPGVVVLSTVTVSAIAVAAAGTPHRPATDTRTICLSTRSNPVPSRTSASRQGLPASNRDVVVSAITVPLSGAVTEVTDASNTATSANGRASSRLTGAPPPRCNTVVVGSAVLHAPRRGVGGIERPLMLRIAAGELLADACPTAFPEARQIGGDLDRPVGGGEKMQHDRTPAGRRVPSRAEQVLHANARDRLVVRVVDRHSAAARQLERRRRELVEPRSLRPRQLRSQDRREVDP